MVFVQLPVEFLVRQSTRFFSRYNLLVIVCFLAIVENKPLFDESDDSSDINNDERNTINVDRQARATFTFLGGGYSKDSWNVYFGGRKVDGASAQTFKTLGGGYGKDNWSVYFQDKKVDGASALTFQSLGGGYGKDNWNVYSMGVRIPGASPNSFQFSGMGRKRQL